MKEIPHTATSEEEHELSVRVVDERLEAAFEMNIPDLSGETFQAHLESRAWTPDFDADVARVDGILLFANPRHLNQPAMILQVEQDDPDLEEESDDGEVSSWTYDDLPTSVALVELLQFIEARSRSTEELRIAVMISAWDTVRDRFDSVEKYLELELPLLWQHLHATRPMAFRVFGVSAQGGDYDSESDMEVLADHERARLCFVVQTGDTVTHDITSPFRWLMDLSSD